MLVKYLQSWVLWLLKATLNHKVGLPALCRETAELNKGFSCAFIREQKFCISGKPSVCYLSENRNFAYLGNSMRPSESFV